MENIFNKIEILSHYFDSISIKTDLWIYLIDNLDKENYQTFCWDLSIALTTNANEEYI